MSTLLDLIVEYLLVADVPEVIIRNYLPGNDCLDEDTVQQVFTTKYCRDGRTYIDKECTVLHSFNDEPAEILYFGRYWYSNGRLHRKNGKPSIIYYDGQGDKPALAIDGQQEWYFMGKLHRDGDQPAIVLPDGEQEWFRMGKRHRDGGKPAVILSNGTKVYYVDGKRCARIKKVKK